MWLICWSVLSFFFFFFFPSLQRTRRSRSRRSTRTANGYRRCRKWRWAARRRAAPRYERGRTFQGAPDSALSSANGPASLSTPVTRGRWVVILIFLNRILSIRESKESWIDAIDEYRLSWILFRRGFEFWDPVLEKRLILNLYYSTTLEV